MSKKSGLPTLRIGERPLSIEDVDAAAAGRVHVALSSDASFTSRIARGAAIVEHRLAANVPTYGVNTGFGASVRNQVATDYAYALAKNLPRYHGCGVGPMLTESESRAVMLVRLVSLATGYSGVRFELLSRMCKLLEVGAAPVIPSRGSVGASGDLTPLSYVAALLVGERAAWLDGQVVEATRALERAELGAWSLAPKESLAIMNGTSVMAALGCLAFKRAERAARSAALLTAMQVEAMQAQYGHYDARLFQAKAHPGQSLAAARIRGDLGIADKPGLRGARIQERYSLRCAPHIIGPLVDALFFSRAVIEAEINGASDNPLFDPESGDVLHGGNFYGGHLAMVADLLKTQVANLADLAERQLVLLNNPHENGGLPENLVLLDGPRRASHHGFKAMEISASALTAEALKLTMPASVFSRSTESHNQDKVSMGSLAVLDLLGVLDLVETVQAIQLIACAQAFDCRERLGAGLLQLAETPRAVWQLLRQHVPCVDEDRPLDGDIEAALALLRGEQFLAVAGELGQRA
jgi:histidine ammonia-lyase